MNETSPKSSQKHVPAAAREVLGVAYSKLPLGQADGYYAWFGKNRDSEATCFQIRVENGRAVGRRLF